MSLPSYKWVFLIVYFLTISFSEINADKPCAARPIQNRSVVCVCNVTYCDEVIREQPAPGTFVAYTSSKAPHLPNGLIKSQVLKLEGFGNKYWNLLFTDKALYIFQGGLRFKKSFGYFRQEDCSQNTDILSLHLDPTTKYQKIWGFGGAITDAVGVNWESLPKVLQKYLINSYFGETGIEYNLVRLPIGGCDFSVRYYTYDDWPGDTSLKNFSLQYEDYHYKIPMLREIFKVTKRPIKIIGVSWTPPRWMKAFTEQTVSCGYLKPEFFQTFADYLLKFVESYEAQGISIWAISTSNEPSLAYIGYGNTVCLGWTNNDMGNWIVNNLGPTIRNSTYSKLKILTLDDQRYTIKISLDTMVQMVPRSLHYLDGLAVHYYSDSYVSPNVLSYAAKKYSKLFIINTEASAGVQGTDVILGSWARGSKYAKDIIQDLTHYVTGWVDWNICLNTAGGPNVQRNYVDSPVIVNATNNEFLKQPMFYVLGHFSKFITPGSYRIGLSCPPCDCIPSVAFLTPANTVVVVLHNEGPPRSILLKLNGKEALIYLEKESISTVEFSYEQ